MRRRSRPTRAGGTRRRGSSKRTSRWRRRSEGSVVTSRSRSAVSKLADAAPLFAALGDQTRLLIVTRLCERGPLSTARLTDGTAISRQAISKHLDALAKARLVHSERMGRERIWRLEAKRLADVRRYLSEISDQWDDALGRLRAFVEEDA